MIRTQPISLLKLFLLYHSILNIDETVRPKVLFSFATFDSFLSGLGAQKSNQTVDQCVYGACCSAQTVHKLSK